MREPVSKDMPECLSVLVQAKPTNAWTVRPPCSHMHTNPKHTPHLDSAICSTVLCHLDRTTHLLGDNYTATGPRRITTVTGEKGAMPPSVGHFAQVVQRL